VKKWGSWGLVLSCAGKWRGARATPLKKLFLSAIKFIMKKISSILIVFAVMFLTGAVSCSSAKLHVKEGSEYSPEKLSYKVGLFAQEVHSLGWRNYSVDLKEQKLSGKKANAAILKEYPDAVRAFSGTFISEMEPAFDCTFVYTADEKKCYLKAGRSAAKILVQNDERIVSTATPVPIVIVKTNEYEQKGKTYTLVSEIPFGMKVYVYGEEYALVDLYSYPADFLVNKKFSRVLTQEENEFVAAAVFASYDYFKTLAEKEKTGLSTYYSSY